VSSVVSIVLPVYKPDLKFLEMVLKSIHWQQYKPMELIISDDSEVASMEIDALLNKYKELIDLRYTRNELGRGIFSNLNNGIRHSTGDFIQIFSQDDVMKDGFIENQVASFGQDPKIGMVFSAFEEIDAADEVKISRTKKLFDPGKSMSIASAEIAEMFVRYGCFVGNISPVMIRREVITSIGYFNEALRYAADFEYWIRISKTYNLYYNSNIGLSVRNHAERASQVLSNHQLMSDLTYVYALLLDRIPEDRKAIALKDIQKRVGSAFVHHTIREVLHFNWPLSELKRRYMDLNKYPFNTISSIRYYLLSIPGRIWSRLVIF
jgi:glycosyltransferase involved in cell wall biosynthesis